MTLKVFAASSRADWEAAFYSTAAVVDSSIYYKMANAAGGAMKAAADLLKKDGRANIQAAGFSYRWQNTWRVNVYPVNKASLEPVVFGYHKISYSMLFEDGGVVRPHKNLLWLPLSTVPKNGRRRNYTPREIAQTYPLFTISRPGKAPLLASNVNVTDAERLNYQGNAKLRRSLNAKLITLGRKIRKTQGRRKAPVVTVPLFVGIKEASIGKKFDLAGVADRVREQLPSLYYANVRD